MVFVHQMKPSHHEIISVICRVTGIPLEMRCRLFDMPIVLLLSLNLGMTPQKFPRIQPRFTMGSMTGKSQLNNNWDIVPRK